MKKRRTSFKISCSIGIILCLILSGCGKTINTQKTSVKTTSPTTTTSTSNTLMTTTTSGSKNLAGKIVFASSDASGDFEIYVVNADGTNLKKLTNNSVGAQYPVWSPDGRKIAFAATKDGGIYTMNADGTNLTRIVFKTKYDEYTEKDYVCENTAPSWSPDGSMICYESYGDEDSGTTVPNANIYVVNSDGTNIRRVTSGLTYEGQPAWSPDGSKIAFVYIKNEDNGFSNNHIYVMNSDGSNWVQLTDSKITINNLNPAWSPDGTKIIFSGDGTEKQGIFCIKLKDKSQTYVGIGSDPQWSPDGTNIIVNRWSEGRSKIYVMNADGSNVSVINVPIDAREPVWISQ